MPGEYHEFEAHPNLIQSVVLHQSGTLEKALMELLMNSGDGQATRVDLTIDESGFVLQDDGRGFAGDNDGGKLSEEEAIRRGFHFFGSPHKEGDATWGRFRSGRGQIMSFARVVWESGNYRLSVDFRRRPGYLIERMETPVKGCIVRGTFYEREEDLHWTLDKLQKAIRYMQFPIYFNGERVTIPLSKVKWDAETDEAYFKFTSAGGLAVYNLGVIVDYYSGEDLGNGVVVSKKRLLVNLARNDIHERDCPVWKKIKARLREQVRVKIRRGLAGDDDRAAIIKQIIRGEAPLVKFGDVPVITDVTGRNHPLSALAKADTLSVAPRGDVLGDKVMQRGQAFVVAQETLDRFGVQTLDDLVTLVNKVADEQKQYRYGISPEVKQRTVAALTSDLKTTKIILGPADLTPVERQMLAMLNFLSYRIQLVINLSGFVKIEGPRKFFAAESNIAAGWTDGDSFIAIERGQLTSAAKDGIAGMFRLLLLIVHEYMHYSSSAESHVHGPEFHENFHDVMSYAPAKVDKSVRLPYTIHSLPERMLSTLQKIQANDAKRAARGKSKGGKNKPPTALPDDLDLGLDDDGDIYEE